MTREEALYRIAELYLDVPPHVVKEYLGEQKWNELVDLHAVAFDFHPFKRRTNEKD